MITYNCKDSTNRYSKDDTCNQVNILAIRNILISIGG